MREAISHNRIVFHVPDDLLDFLDEECARYALSRSAILRQSLDLRRVTQRRRAATEAEVFAVAEGVS